MKLYDVLLKRHSSIGHTDPRYIVIYSDEDRKKALKEMERYRKANGFVVPDKTETVADILLRERTATGKVISVIPYHELFG